MLRVSDHYRDPPTAELVEWGKLKYEQQKSSKRSAKRFSIKEKHVRDTISNEDMNVKVSAAVRLLKRGHLVQLTVELKDACVPTIAARLIVELYKAVEHIASLDGEPALERSTTGSSLVAFFVPRA